MTVTPMITVDNTSSGRFLGLTLRGCERTLYVRASSIVTICEAVQVCDRKLKFDFTSVHLVNLDGDIEVQNPALDILEKL